MDEGDGVAGVGQQVVLNANLEKVGHREVLGRHLGIPTSFFTYQEKGVRFLREKVGHSSWPPSWNSNQIPRCEINFDLQKYPFG